MGAYYDEIEIEDMMWDSEKRVYHYPCPCGDRFEISRNQLANYEDIATCPSCSLIIRVIYDPVSEPCPTREVLLPKGCVQLDYEDDDVEDEDDVSTEEEESHESGSDEFEDALEKLDIKDEYEDR